MKQLHLRNGSFYRGAELAPAAIGNAEQIQLLKAEERRLEEIENRGIDCSFYELNQSYDVIAEFHCICGGTIKNEERIYRGLDNSESHYEGKDIQCSQCKRIYTIIDGYAKIQLNKPRI